ncbi:hypothetical protein TGDOM2_281500A [Toxoplasma gondii GAB2-2007-GAL-DOM2]|uniref:Uncharacterized protein n=1 Tax=Toxoplasma gondii GAB2-2007-GAL-DOM2 TaxID=1130820 RepID=A0A086KA19_TOXGO|nr:hypothetical protein TGDOM2_281500A [Toxoplasma gondii GAB2-2007-GAL-DOM2]
MFLLRSHLSRLAASFYSKEREHPLLSVDGRDGCSSSYVLSRSTATGLGEEKAEVEETELRRTTESALLPSHEDIAAALTDSLKTLLRYASRLHDPSFFPTAAPSFTSSPVNDSSSASSSVSPTAPQLASDWRFSSSRERSYAQAIPRGEAERRRQGRQELHDHTTDEKPPTRVRRV